jgi:hypothetical protein
VTQPGPPPPNWTPPPGWTPPPAPDNSSRTLKLSGAALIWVIIGVTVLCLGVPALCCGASLIGGAANRRDRPAYTTTP